MKRDMERVRELLPAHEDPARVDEPSPGLSARAEQDLAALRRSAAHMRSETARPGGLGRRRVLAAVAVCAGAFGVVLNGGLPWPGTNAGTPAAAVTPPVLSLTPVQGKPADYLNQLADRVAELPAEHDEGAYQYTKTWGWWLHTAADVPGGAANAAVPTITETWIDKRDSGRRLSTYGDPIFPDPKQEQAARDAGLVAGKKIDDDRYGAGKFPDAGQTWQGIEPFSHNPDQLAGQLKQVNWEGGMIIFGVSDMLHYAERSGPVDPKLRAAALRVLADTPGLKVSTATTWKGRHVVAVTQEKTWHGSTERNSIFFTPDTAYPVGSEEALFGNARQLNVRVPATLAVTETIERRPVTTVQERP